MSWEIVGGVEPGDTALVPDVEDRRHAGRIVERCGVDAERCARIILAEQKIGAAIAAEFAARARGGAKGLGRTFGVTKLRRGDGKPCHDRRAALALAGAAMAIGGLGYRATKAIADGAAQAAAIEIWIQGHDIRFL